MTSTPGIREQVRQRANLACEFCGVTETDAGGELTLDHFQPRAKGGTDDLDNLLYCCPRCNQYKLDYWPVDPRDPSLWNPRHEPASTHFIELDDGTLRPLSASGVLTLKRPFASIVPRLSLAVSASSVKPKRLVYCLAGET